MIIGFKVIVYLETVQSTEMDRGGYPVRGSPTDRARPTCKHKMAEGGAFDNATPSITE